MFDMLMGIIVFVLGGYCAAKLQWRGFERGWIHRSMAAEQYKDGQKSLLVDDFEDYASEEDVTDTKH